MDDFIETMWQHQHFSYAKISESYMGNFRNLLLWCDRHGLDYFGTDWSYDIKEQEK